MLKMLRRCWLLLLTKKKRNKTNRRIFLRPPFLVIAKNGPRFVNEAKDLLWVFLA